MPRSPSPPSPLATFWTVDVVRRPFGRDVNVATSEPSYFDWSPRDTVPGLPRTALIGKHGVPFHLPERASWMTPISAWAEPIMGTGGTTLDQVDSLLVWWHRHFASFPTYRTAFRDLVPIPILLADSSVNNQIVLCGPQVRAFQIILTSRGFISRWAYLSGTTAKGAYAGHIVIEAWVPEWKKWVLLDPMMGTRYIRAGVPLSLREMSGLYHAGMIGETKVVSMREVQPWREHRFPTRHVALSDMALYFASPGIWANPDHLAADRPETGSTRYYVTWDPAAGTFDVSREDNMTLFMKIARTAGAWAAALIATAAGVLTVRRRDNLVMPA